MVSSFLLCSFVASIAATSSPGSWPGQVAGNASISNSSSLFVIVLDRSRHESLKPFLAGFHVISIQLNVFNAGRHAFARGVDENLFDK
jgi:hypothetical protein